MASNSGNKKSFWERKQEAFRLFGKAASRPQQNFRSYLLAKRKLNLGITETSNNKIGEIMQWNMDYDGLQPASKNIKIVSSPANDDSIWTMVETQEKFQEMMRILWLEKEITLDFECNQDHSYYGMTALIQIGTTTHTFLVDPFPLYDIICNDLIPVFESTEITKIMLGSANDIISVNRDFGANLVGVVDIQFLHQRIQKKIRQMITENDDRLNTLLKTKHNLLCCIVGININRRNGNDFLRMNHEISKLISMKNLMITYFPNTYSPPDATLADWRIRPLKEGMINYAIFDVQALMAVWELIKTKLLSEDAFKICIGEAVNDTKNLLTKTFKRPAEVSFGEDFLKHKRHLPPDAVEAVPKMVWEYRNLHAKLIDEPCDAILNMWEIYQLCFDNPKSQENFQKVMLKYRINVRESLGSWDKPILRILNEGETFFKNIMTLGKCHVCSGKYKYPHLAWGCVETYSTLAVARYMNKPQNKAFRDKEDNRRQNNWEKKHGPSPCPYLPRNNFHTN